MHILMFLDQHPDTLGGGQLSVKLQAKYLRRLGHQVTLCAPRSRNFGDQSDIVTYSSLVIDKKSGYTATCPTAKLQRQLDADISQLPPVDVVHIHADYWGAVIGFAFAKRHNIPSVITFHTNIATGTPVVLGWLTRPFIWLLSLSLRINTGVTLGPQPGDSWRYLAKLSNLADMRLSPTAHFAETLRQHKVHDDIVVNSNGVDDDIVSKIKRSSVKRQRPRIVWAGRFSGEKRLIEFLEAVSRANIDADVSVYGDGGLMTRARSYVRHNQLQDTVTLHGSVSSEHILQQFADSDVLAQTSVGFETQGRTVFESLVLGTPVLLCDPKIAEDLPKDSYWLTPDVSVAALTSTLRRVADDIDKGSARLVDPEFAKRFLQSSLALEIEGLYERVITDNIVVQ